MIGDMHGARSIRVAMHCAFNNFPELSAIKLNYRRITLSVVPPNSIPVFEASQLMQLSLLILMPFFAL
jgi:hypothetical protein